MKEKSPRMGEIPINSLPVPESWNSFLNESSPIIRNHEAMLELPSKEFLGHISKLTSEVVASPDYHDETTGYISDASWKKLVEGGILSPVLKERDTATRHQEVMQVGRVLSYYDINLGLSYGIVFALAIITIQRYGSEEQKVEILDIIKKGGMVGLGITERKTSGTAALHMKGSTYEIIEGEVYLEFDKHWQGLSGKEGLIIAAKDLRSRKIGLFFVPQEEIETELIKTVGLKGIPYGTNKGKIIINKAKCKLVELKSPREFQDIFIKSRLFFIIMMLGQQERILMEANDYATKREIGNVKQKDLLVVRRQLDDMLAKQKTTEAMFNIVLGLDVSNVDTLGMVAQADIIKVLSTEFAVLGAGMRADLLGAAAFRVNGALQKYIDLYPFRIFEGPEPHLNTQLGGLLLKGFSTSEGIYNNFLDFFEENISKKELFNGSLTIENLDASTIQLLEKIHPQVMTDDLKEVIGRICSRMFALGCLDNIELATDQYKKVVTMLNYEISVEVLKFISRKNNPLI